MNAHAVSGAGAVGTGHNFPKPRRVERDHGAVDISTRDDWIVDFCYPILSCFGKMISVSDHNPVLDETILSVSENYPKVYCDAQHTFLCCVYFAS